MSTSPIIIFDARWSPIFYVAYPRPFSVDDWAQLLKQFDHHLDRNVPFGWVNDARTPYLPNAHNRATLAEHQKRRAADYRRLVKEAERYVRRCLGLSEAELTITREREQLAS